MIARENFSSKVSCKLFLYLFTEYLTKASVFMTASE